MTDNNIGRKKRTDVRLTLLAALYFAGVFLGVILYGTLSGEQLDALNGLTGSFVIGRLNHTFWETLVNSFSGAFLLLTACFWLGFSAAVRYSIPQGVLNLRSGITYLKQNRSAMSSILWVSLSSEETVLSEELQTFPRRVFPASVCPELLTTIFPAQSTL